jgi:hypothetical protein
MKMITRNSHRTIAIGRIATLLGLASFAYAQQAGDVLFKAMQDELDRTVSQLVMENLERPYFVSYTVDDVQQLEVHGSLGTLTQSNPDRGRYLSIDLRVGNYSLDNSNFVSGFSGYGTDYSQLPIDNNYDAIRNQIYLQRRTGDNLEKAGLSSNTCHCQSSGRFSQAASKPNHR